MQSEAQGRGHCRSCESSRRLGVSPELLRTWERLYDRLSPTRTEGGFRLYTREAP